ncbi:MAG: hypothetical protein OEV00_12415 [Acidobacteriota bacterium]|nr:hypothetical protein [Acidobacteriota bacterium]MDH3786115.1 hypothetical protein [Acidobacteriota bacterium]
MLTMSLARRLSIAILLILVPALALAQEDPKPKPTSGNDRMFLSFIEDAAVVDSQWWEGQLELVDGDGFDATIVRLVAAFQPYEDIEVGGRVGFGDTDIAGIGTPDGSGATDLDLWFKYHLGSNRGNGEFAVGGTLVVPTGDDTAGLGFDAFAASAFGAGRWRLDRGIVSGHVGLQINGDGRIFGSPDIDGEIALQAGIGLLFPVSDTLSVIGEFDYNGERFEGADSDSRVLGGVNWRVTNRGSIRGAVSLGLTDGAPDATIIGGYAAVF